MRRPGITEDGGVDAMNELLAEVRAARRTEKTLERHTDRIKELLIEVRRQNPKLKVHELEEMIGRYYDRATISRVTAEPLGLTREKKATDA
jgi:hypothetical protein